MPYAMKGLGMSKLVVAVSVGLLLTVRPGNSGSSVEADPGVVAERKKGKVNDDDGKKKKSELPEPFAPSTKVPVGLPVDFPADI